MNNKFLKAGILIAILVIPAFVFIFLNTFGSNKFDLPYLFPELNESGQVKIMDGDTVFHQIDSVVLFNDQNKVVNITADTTQIKIVNFFFSRCGTICPVINTNMARLADNFKEYGDVAFYSITVDPAYDRDSVLTIYKKSFGEGLKNWELLTGDKDYIYQKAIGEFKLPVSDAFEYDKEIKNVDELFIHSEKVLMLDSKNYVRGMYDGTNKDDIERLKAEIKVLSKTLE